MIHYDDPSLKVLEDEIRYLFGMCDYEEITKCECLLRARRDILNEMELAHQAELLPDIIAFNDALTDALKRMYERAHEVYAQVSSLSSDVHLEAKCFLSYDYPSLHPYQADDREELWGALCDTGLNKLYDSGVTFTLELPRDKDESFDFISGLDCTPPNWNEGLNQELTKNLQLNRAFHNLFDHTYFALTDFIFVRNFNIEININFEEPVK